MNVIPPYRPGDGPSSPVSQDPAVVGLLHELVEAARSRGAVTVRLVPAEEKILVTYCIENLAGDRDRGSSSIPKQFYSALVNHLQHRSFSWPEYQPSMFITNGRAMRRIFFSAPGHVPVMIDVSIEQKSGISEPAVTLSLASSENDTTVLDVLDLSAFDRQALSRIASVKAGIILANTTPQSAELDARAVMLALVPRALYYPRISSTVELEDALMHGLDNVVIIGSDCQEPLEQITQFLHRCKDRPDFIQTALRHIRGSIVHRRAKRICGTCARPTVADPHTLSKIPEVIRPAAGHSYVFGRGCADCGHSSYRGSVGISSVIEINDTLRELLKQGGGDRSLAQCVYEAGTRTLLEDGLRKLFSHLTSFEAVLHVAPSIAKPFEAVIAAAKTNSVTEFALPQFSNGSDKGSNGHSAGKRRIMIVEDDQDQRQVLQVLFDSSGYDVITAKNGHEALQQLRRTGADVVVCDLMMPVMNGAELIKRLKADKALAHVPVLMLTAVSDSEAECALLDKGADDYCEKRIKRRVLLKRVEKLLEKR